MVLRKFMGIFVITLIIGTASLAMAGVPDVNNCLASRAYTGTEKLIVLAVPGGAVEARFNLAVQFVPPQDPGAAQVIQDGTITVTVKDGASPPQVIANYPAVDIYLVNPGLAGEVGLTACLGGTVADGPTDAAGETEFQDPVGAGGFTTELCTVVINGNAVPGQQVDVGFNSPDNDGNLVVNGIDLQAFASDYFGAYAFRSDLYHDGIVNGIDLQIFASHYGAVCN